MDAETVESGTPSPQVGELQPEASGGGNATSKRRGKKKPRGKAFTGGDDPRAAQNQDLAPGPAVPYEEGVPRQLTEMRYVAAVARGAEESPAVAAQRAWLRSDPKRFMAQLAKLEEGLLTFRKAEAGGSGSAAVGVSGVVPDVGTEKCVELCEKLMAGWRAE